MNFFGIELIRSIKNYALQKNLKTDDVIHAIEKVIRDSEIKKYNYDKINVKIINEGEVQITKEVHVTDDVYLEGGFDEEGFQYISLKNALDIDPNAKVDDILQERLSDFSLMRYEINSAKKFFFAALNDLIREKQYEDFKDRIGQIFTFLVLRVENGNLILLHNGVETILPRRRLIAGQIHRKDEQVKVYIEDVIRSDRGSQIIASRNHKDFLAALFIKDIPEVYEGIVEIKAVARLAGLRSKIAVYASDQSIDPVGACIGIRGARITPIINELNGESIDVVRFSTDLNTFIKNIFGASNVSKIKINEENDKIDLVIFPEKINVVIGKKGQNIFLASQLLGKKINVISTEDESKQLMEEFEKNTELLMDSLEIEKVMAQLLLLNGLNTVTKLSEATITDIVNIEGFDEEIAEELLSRARDYLAITKQDNNHEQSILDNIDNSSTDNQDNKNIEIQDFDDQCLTQIIKDKLKENKIYTTADLADLSVDELEEIIGDDLNYQDMNNLIIKVREFLGWI